MAFDKIFMKRRFLNYLIFSGILFTNIINPNKSIALTQDNIDIPKVVSYRSASCGCCKKWIYHLRDNGLEVVDNIVEDVLGIKNQYQIPNNLRSCHTAQIANYTIEGHVPIESINKLFREKPNINGIAVPGMPLGSPGMEMHSHNSHSHDYENYTVVSFSNTGKTKIFDKISPKEKYLFEIMHIILRNFKFFLFIFFFSLNFNSYMNAHMRGTFLSEEEAEKRASELGCEGIHKNQDKWMPCKNEKELHIYLRK